MKKILSLTLITLFLLVFVSCALRDADIPPLSSEDSPQPSSDTVIAPTDDKAKEDGEKAEDTPSLPQDVDPITVLLDEMTLDEKIGQLFVVIPEAMNLSLSDGTQHVCNDPVTEVNETIRAFYDKYPAGGFALFGQNVVSPEQLKTLTDDLHSLGSVMICIDEEGGRVTRIAGKEGFDVPVFPDMQSIADTGDPSKAYLLGQTVGDYLSEYGIDVDFAPVADVNTNPENTVIGVRAFGSDPTLAGEMVANVINGLHESGVISCIKHFPGHGDTLTDTHKGYAETQKTWDEIEQCEMVPFKAGIEAGADLVMVAHISAPDVTGSSEPASLSYTLVTEKLRGELSFDGVIITDSMTMGAVANDYSAGDAAVKALLAGVDIILTPKDYVEAFEAVRSALTSGEITPERLDESVMRILRLKQSYGIG